MKPQPLFSLIFISWFLILVTSCAKDDNNNNTGKNEEPKETESQIELKFVGYFNGAPLQLNDKEYITAQSDTVIFTRVRFLLSDLALFDGDGNSYSLDTFIFAALDLEDPSPVLRIPYKSSELKSIQGIQMQVGLNEDENHGDPMQWPTLHPLNPLRNHMHWTWASGYIFKVVEGYYRSSRPGSLFSFHMANLQYRKPISLSTGEIQFNNPVQLEIRVHMDQYFSGVHPYSLVENGPISHSTTEKDMELMDLLYSNLSAVFEAKKL